MVITLVCRYYNATFDLELGIKISLMKIILQCCKELYGTTNPVRFRLVRHKMAYFAKISISIDKGQSKKTLISAFIFLSF